MHEFAWQGVAGTSAERIAEIAGYTRGAFYANYANKQALLLDLLGAKMEAEQESWIALANAPADLEATLQLLDERARAFDPNGLLAMIGNEIYTYALRDPEFAVQYNQYHRHTLEMFTRILEGVFRMAGKKPPVSLEEVCEAMLTLNRNVRIGVGQAAPQPYSATLLIQMLRGLIAIAEPLAAPPPEPG